jgi:hypothetical protein
MSEYKTVDIKGLLDTYEFPFILPGSRESLMIKPITTGQMKKILAYEDETDPYVIEEALDKLISDCVVNPEFNLGTIYLQDRFSLLLEIRKVTKGDTYTFNRKCNKCSVENIENIKISELEVKPLEVADNILTINERLKFEVDFPTRNDQIDSIMRNNDPKLSFRMRQVEVQTGTYANSIKKVHTPDGEHEDIPYKDKVYILENIPSEVFEKFTTWFKDHDFGVQFKQNLICFGCGHKETIEIPLSDFFV